MTCWWSQVWGPGRPSQGVVITPWSQISADQEICEMGDSEGTNRRLGGGSVSSAQVKLDYLRKHLSLGRAPAWTTRATTTNFSANWYLRLTPKVVINDWSPMWQIIVFQPQNSKRSIFVEVHCMILIGKILRNKHDLFQYWQKISETVVCLIIFSILVTKRIDMLTW